MARAKKPHYCSEHCFPTVQITYFCFKCGEEKFKPEIAKHGWRRTNQTADGWATWYLCRTCDKAWKSEIEKNRGPQDESWLKTTTGLLKQGPQGVPSAKTLQQRKSQGRFLK